MGPDLGLCLLTASQYPYIAHVPDALCFFRAHHASFTASTRAQTRLWNYNRVRKAHLERSGDWKHMRRWVAWSWFMAMAASGRPVRLSDHLKDLDIKEMNFRPKLLDLLWGGTAGMWPALVKQSRRFGFLRGCGARQSMRTNSGNSICDEV